MCRIPHAKMTSHTNSERKWLNLIFLATLLLLLCQLVLVPQNYFASQVQMVKKAPDIAGWSLLKSSLNEHGKVNSLINIDPRLRHSVDTNRSEDEIK